MDSYIYVAYCVILLLALAFMWNDIWKAKRENKREIQKLADEINQRPIYQMDQNIRPILPTDLVLFPSGVAIQYGQVEGHDDEDCGHLEIVRTGTPQWCALMASHHHDDSSLETTEDEARPFQTVNCAFINCTWDGNELAGVLVSGKPEPIQLDDAANLASIGAVASVATGLSSDPLQVASPDSRPQWLAVRDGCDAKLQSFQDSLCKPGNKPGEGGST